MDFQLKEIIDKYGNVFKNIVAETLRECNYKNVKVNSDVVSYAALLFYLNCEESFLDVGHMNFARGNVESFVRKTVSRIAESDSPYMKSLELQITFMNSPIDTDPTKFKPKQPPLKAELLVKDILEVDASTKEEQDRLFKKILYDIIIFNKLGTPTNHKVVVETSNALKSVMTREDLNDFAIMKKRKRLQTLTTLRKIVCGIMIFNHDAGECGEEIRNIRKDVREAYQNTRQAISNNFNKNTNLVNDCANILRQIVIVNEEDNLLSFGYPNEQDIKSFLKVLQLYNQHQFYLKSLNRSVMKMQIILDELTENFNSNLKKLHEIVQYRIAVPTESVFPFFIELSEIWHTLWQYLYVMVDMNKLNIKMNDIVKVKNHAEIMDKFHEYSKYKQEFVSQNIELSELKVEGGEWLMYSPKLFSVMASIQYCAYMIVIGNGLLFQSKLSIGILKYKDKYYAFSDVNYARIFIANIEYFENKYMAVIQTNAHLIVFFGFYDEVRKFKHVERIHMTTKKDVETTKSIEIQTDLHPLPFSKDNYDWNIWDLRRKAVQLNRIKKCQTHSAQTVISYHRRSVMVEAADKKVVQVQTKKSTSVMTTQT